MSKLEGSGAARMVQLMRQHGYNKDVDVELGTVTSAPPSIKIRLDLDGIELYNDDVVVAESLTERTLTVSLTGGSMAVTDGQLTIKSPLKVGDRVIVLSVNNGQQYYVLDKVVTY